jgi:hypothetical protein
MRVALLSLVVAIGCGNGGAAAEVPSKGSDSAIADASVEKETSAVAEDSMPAVESGACHDLALSGPVLEARRVEEMPPPKAAGTLPDGVYRLVDVIVYPSSAMLPAPVRQVLRVRDGGTTLDLIVEHPGELRSGTVTLKTTDGWFAGKKFVCGNPTTPTVPFSPTSDGMIFHAGGDSNPITYVFKKE